MNFAYPLHKNEGSIFRINLQMSKIEFHECRMEFQIIKQKAIEQKKRSERYTTPAYIIHMYIKYFQNLIR